MNLFAITLMIAALALCGCRSTRTPHAEKTEVMAVAVENTNSTPEPLNLYHYSVRAGGPNSFVGMTNRPESNRVRIGFKKWGGVDPESEHIAVFGLTNGESREILLHNVRVQVPAADGGTDGFGWDTVYDDYPSGTSDYNTAIFPVGKSGEFVAPRPEGKRWRVCVLYSIRDEASTEDPTKQILYCGNYEVVSSEMK